MRSVPYEPTQRNLKSGDCAMKRREMLLATGAAALGLSMFPLGLTRAANRKAQKILYFTRSVGFEHSPVHRNGDELSFSEKLITEAGQKHVTDGQPSHTLGADQDFRAFELGGDRHSGGAGDRGVGSGVVRRRRML